jgi:hypothetical protein
MSNEFNIHFKGMRIPVVRQSMNNAPRLFWCQTCGAMHDDFDAGNFVKYVLCFCGNSKCIEILHKEDIQNILEYMRQNKKERINKEDLMEILI